MYVFSEHLAGARTCAADRPGAADYNSISPAGWLTMGKNKVTTYQQVELN